MAEMDYESRIAQAKAELESYSAEQEAIRKLYEQAKQNAQANYESRQKQLDERASQSRNQAAVDSLRTEKNIGQTLASRGLAFSGENAQTHLDLNLNLQNRLAEIDRDTAAQKSDLEQEKTQKLTEIDMEAAKRRASDAETRAGLQAELAKIQAERDQAQSAENGTESTKNDGENGTESTENETVAVPDLTGKNIWQRIRLLLQYAAKVQAANGTEETTGSTPSVSARDLAKQLVQSASGGTAVSGYEQQEMLRILLEAMAEDYDMEEGYYKELLLNLQSMGYRPNYAEDIYFGTTELQEESAKAYTEAYDNAMQIYPKIGYTDYNEIDRLAGEYARFAQLLYLYTHSRDIETFEAAVHGVSLQGDLETFYEKVNESPEKYVLASEWKGE